jgi:hypothetical protein
LPIGPPPAEPDGDLPLSGVALPLSVPAEPPFDWVPAEGSEGSGEPVDGGEGMEEPVPPGIDGVPEGDEVGEGMPVLPVEPPLGGLGAPEEPPLGGLGAPGAPGAPPLVLAQPAISNGTPSSDARIAAGSSGACARERAAFISWHLCWRWVGHAPRRRTIHLR